jgi:hypothetical protein
MVDRGLREVRIGVLDLHRVVLGVGHDEDREAIVAWSLGVDRIDEDQCQAQEHDGRQEVGRCSQDVEGLLFASGGSRS